MTYDYSLKGYIQTMVENGTVWGQLQKLREPVSDSAADSSGREQQPADPVSGGGSGLPAWCGECDASGAHNPRLRLVQRPPWETGPDDRCAACHPARVAALEGTDAA